MPAKSRALQAVRTAPEVIKYADPPALISSKPRYKNEMAQKPIMVAKKRGLGNVERVTFNP